MSFQPSQHPASTAHPNPRQHAHPCQLGCQLLAVGLVGSGGVLGHLGLPLPLSGGLMLAGLALLLLTPRM